MSEITKTAKGPLYDVIDYQGKKYITSHRLHEDIKPTSDLKSTNRAIRTAETYKTLFENGNILELSYEDVKALGDRSSTDLVLLFSSNGYKPVVLIDPVAQKALTHHFEETAQQAVGDSKLAAAFALFEVDPDEILDDRTLMYSLRAFSKAKKAEKEAQQAKELAIEAKLEALAAQTRVGVLEGKVKEMGGDLGYSTILGLAIRVGIKSLSRSQASKYGKQATAICAEQNIYTPRVKDPRFGYVSEYPDAVVASVLDKAHRANEITVPNLSALKEALNSEPGEGWQQPLENDD